MNKINLITYLKMEQQTQQINKQLLKHLGIDKSDLQKINPKIDYCELIDKSFEFLKLNNSGLEAN